MHIKEDKSQFNFGHAYFIGSINQDGSTKHLLVNGKTTLGVQIRFCVVHGLNSLNERLDSTYSTTSLFFNSIILEHGKPQSYLFFHYPTEYVFVGLCGDVYTV